MFFHGKSCLFSWFLVLCSHCFSAFLLFLLLCFHCFSAFIFASLLFLLCCFSAICFHCFFAFLLLCFPCFSAFLPLCFCAFLPIIYYSFFSFLRSCVFAAPLPAPLLLYFLSLLYLSFSLSFAFFCPVCILDEAEERLSVTPNETLKKS